MKIFKIFLIFILSSTLIFASLEVGGLIEITEYLNARSSLKFYKATPNVVKTLSPGSKGEIEVVSKLPSGNYGLKVKFKDDKNEEKSYWVYYDVKKPRIKLVDQKEEKTEIPEEATSATPQEKIPALVDTAPIAIQEKIKAQPLIDAVNVSQTTLPKIDETLRAQMLAECERQEKERQEKQQREKLALESTPSPQKIVYRSLSNDSETEKVESKDATPSLKRIALSTAQDISTHNIENDVAPLANPYNEPLWYSMNKTNHNGIDLNYSRDDKNKDTLNGFTLRNDGGNNILEKKEGAGRDFEFNFPGLSQSDLSLMIVDRPDGYTSNATYNFMMFFPRKQVPSIKTTSDEYIVKLPTGEEVVYDRKTKAIKSGVLLEKTLKQNKPSSGCNYEEKACGATAASNPVDYQGSGVVLKVSSSGKLPYETAGSIVTISKKGHKECKVPVKQLFYTDSSKRGQNYFNKKFATDEGFNEFLTKKCGFSIEESK